MPRRASRVIALDSQAVHQLCGDRHSRRFAAAVRLPGKGGDPVRLPSRVIVHDAAGNETMASLNVRGLMSLAFTADGQALIVACRGGEGHTVTRLDLATGRAGTPDPLSRGSLLSPDARLVAYRHGIGHSTTYEEDRTYALVVAERETGNVLWRDVFDGWEVGDCEPVAFLTGDRVLFRGRGCHLAIALSTGEATWITDAYRVATALYLPDGHSVIDRVSPDTGLVVTNLMTGLPRPLAGTGKSARLVTPAPDGAHALVVDNEAGVGLWNMDTGAKSVLFEPDLPSSQLTCATFGGDGSLYLGTREGQVLLFDPPVL